MTNTKDLLSIDKHESAPSNFFILDLESKPQESLIPLCLDKLEARGTLKDPEKITADIEKKKLGLKKTMSVDPDFADIICVGVKRVGGEAKLYAAKEMETFFKENPKATLITFNGKNFDIPLLIKYGIKNGLIFPYFKLKEMCRKYNSLYHIDLQELICPFGDYKSKDLLVEIYLGYKPDPIDHNTATEEEERTHCLSDLTGEEGLYLKFKELI